MCGVEKYRLCMVTEALRSGDTGCSVKEYSHGIIGDQAQAWHWTPQRYKQFANSQLKKCRSGQNWV